MQPSSVGHMGPKCRHAAKNGSLGGRAATWEAARYIIKVATAQDGPPCPVKIALRFTPKRFKLGFYLNFLSQCSTAIFFTQLVAWWQEPPFPMEWDPWLWETTVRKLGTTCAQPFSPSPPSESLLHGTLHHVSCLPCVNFPPCLRIFLAYL